MYTFSLGPNSSNYRVSAAFCFRVAKISPSEARPPRKVVTRLAVVPSFLVRCGEVGQLQFRLIEDLPQNGCGALKKRRISRLSRKHAPPQTHKTFTLQCIPQLTPAVPLSPRDGLPAPPRAFICRG